MEAALVINLSILLDNWQYNSLSCIYILHIGLMFFIQSYLEFRQHATEEVMLRFQHMAFQSIVQIFKGPLCRLQLIAKPQVPIVYFQVLAFTVPCFFT